MAMYNKVVYNNVYGGYSIDEKLLARYNELSGNSIDLYDADEIPRHDKHLVQAFEEGNLGKYNIFAIKEIEGNVYAIHEYDGLETVYTPNDPYYPWIIIE